ncbi:LytTr DNA-binding domain-containing protein OS=Ureibacillus acetophenoni OX=614649 GN=SAMN05877842_112121 PE=4 SV=1 [Ureibacillus acetophenoni]
MIQNESKNKGDWLMEMNDLNLSKDELEQFRTILKDWIPSGSSIAIAVDNIYVYISKGIHPLQVEVGDEVDKESVAAKVLKTRTKIEISLENSLFDKPYYTIGYPIYIDQHEAALIIILSSTSIPDKRELNKFITGKQNEDWTPIPIEEISHFESLQKRTWFYSNDDQYISSFTLKELQTKLPDYFVRIHRSYILNIYFVKKITKDITSNFIIVLKNNIELPVSQSYISDIRKALEF